MSCEMQKLGVVKGLRASLQDHASKIIIAESMGNAFDFFEGFDVTLQEELQGVSRVESGKEIPGMDEPEEL